MKKIIFFLLLLIALAFIASFPVVIKSEKNVALVSKANNMKTLWILLKEHKDKYGHYPKNIDDLDNKDYLIIPDIQSFEYVFPKDEILLKSIYDNNVILLYEDGCIEIQKNGKPGIAF